MLWACLLLESLPLDVFARGRSVVPDAAAVPFAVTTGGHYPRIVATDTAAEAAGIGAGMPVATAYALAPDLVLRERDPGTEAAALAAFATWATQFTPGVSLAPPDAVLIDIGGSLRLFGGLAALRSRLQQGSAALGYAVRIAIAPTATAALLFARANRTAPVTRQDALRDALAPLPLTLVDADAACLATLAAAGITTLGAARALPRPGLARRAGTALVETLDRAHGSCPDPRVPFVPPPHYRGRLELPAPVHDAEALVFAARRLADEFAGWLLGRGLGALGVTLVLEHDRLGRPARQESTTRVDFALAVPTREPAHLVGVLRERLIRVALSAPVQSLRLESGRCAMLAGRNLGFLPGDAGKPPVPLLDRLRARLGEDAVTRIATEAEHRPERAWSSHALAASDERGIDPSPGGRGPTPARHRRSTSVSLPPPLAAGPRPLWLLQTPQPLGAELATRPWVLRDGPERIESGWWDGNDIRRDYFVAASPSGARVWLYRDGRRGFGDGEWFAHGLFA
jgi:protein ImuB